MIQEIKNQIHLEYFKNNLSFFLSGFCFLLLIFHIERLWLGVWAVCLIAAIMLSICIKSIIFKFRQSPLFLKIISILFAIGLSCISARRFISIWLPSKMIERLASRIYLSNTVFLFVFAGALALLSLVFLTLFFSLILTELKRAIFDIFQITKLELLFANLKSNILMILSSFAFMGMNAQLSRYGILSILLSYILIVLIFSQVTDIYKKISTISLVIKFYSFLSAVGVCYFSRNVFLEPVSASSLFKRICEKIHVNHLILAQWLSAIVALFSVFAVFVLVSLLLNYVIEKLKHAFKPLSKIELIVYSLLSVILIVFTSVVFLKSNAFWGTNLEYDIVYTSDSPCLVTRNAYLCLYHLQNDLRQPLFAVFAAPLIGFGYALSVPLAHISPVFTPLFMNVIQVLMLVAANLMLAKIINLDTVGRVCFILFTSATYTTLLFSIMMEQYIVAYFWLIFVIYSYIEYKRVTVFSLSVAGGTLLTSLVLMPFSYTNEQKNNISKLQAFVISVENSILGFLTILLTFGRLDVFIGFSKTTKQLSAFAGSEISLVGRIKQYLSFISSCFIAPNAVVDKTTYDHISWQLSKSVISQISIVGIMIIVLCIVGFIANRKNALARISAFWVCFSVLLLCIVGWGSAENGMILYSLYFGWAFIVLLFQLINWCSEKLKFRYLTPIISGIAIVTMAVLNYHGIKALLSFAFTYYPA